MNKRVLVVENDRSEWELIREVFLLRSDEPVWAKSSVEALDRFGTEAFDLVLIEALMPKISGTELCRKIRYSPRGKETSIILTGSVMRNLKIAQQARHQFGADEVLIKPFDTADLKSKLERFLGVEEEDVEEETPAEPLAIDELRDLPFAKAMAGVLPASGKLAEAPGYVLLPYCASLGESGVLKVTSGVTEMLIYIEAGRPVYVASNIRGQSLGQLLLRNGKISESLYRLSLNRMVESGRRQGEVLIDMSALTPHDLFDAMVEQARAKLHTLCGLRKGTYEFSLEEFSCGDECLLTLDPFSVVRSALKSQAGGVAVDKRVGRLMAHRIARLTDAAVPALELSAHESRLIGLVDGKRTLRELADESDMDRREFNPLVLTLLATGQITLLPDDATVDGPLTREQAREAIYGAGAAQAIPPVIEEGYAAFRKALADSMASRVDPTAKERLSSAAAPIRAVSLEGLTPEGRLKAQYVLDRAERAFEELGVDGTDAPEVKTSTGALKRDALLTAEVQFRRGLEELDEGEFDDAVEAFNAAIDMSPGTAEYKAYLGLAVYKAGSNDPAQVEKSLALFAEARDESSHLAVVPYLEARVAVRDGRVEDAITNLEDALAIEPDHADTLQLLYALESDADSDSDNDPLVNGHADASRFRALINVAGRNPYARSHYQLLGMDEASSYADIKRAFFEYSEQLQDPAVLRRMPVGVREEAEVLLHRLEEAYEVLTDPARRGPYDRFVASNASGAPAVEGPKARAAERTFKAGLTALERGDARMAVSQFAKAAAGDPTEPKYHGYLGAALMKQNVLKAEGRDGALRRARESVGRALLLDADHGESNLFLGELLTATGLKLAARRYVRAALTADPKSLDALKLHHELSAADSRRRTADVDIAVADGTEAYLGYAYEIEVAHEKIMRMNFFEILGLSLYANEDDVPEGYQDAVADFTYDDVLEKLDDESRGKAEQIRSRIEEAYQTLRDEESFNDYRRQLRIKMKRRMVKSSKTATRGAEVSIGRKIMDFLNKPVSGGR